MGEQKYRKLVEGEPVNKSTDEVLLSNGWKKMNGENMYLWHDKEPWKPSFREVRRPIK